MKLFGRGQSRSFRCVWAFIEAGVPFEYVHVDRASLPAGYEQMNSQIKVPTLQDGDLVMTESAAIVNLAGRLGDKPLMPKTPQALAAYDDMAFFIMTELEQPLWSIGKHRFAIPEEYRIDAMLKTASWEFDKAQTALMHKLAGREFALGEAFSLVDVLLAQTLNWADRFDMTLNDEMRAYRDRQYDRPACQQALQQVAVD